MDLQMFGAAAALGLAALGSALGTGIASQAAIGGWKKCFQNTIHCIFILFVRSLNECLSRMHHLPHFLQ